MDNTNLKQAVLETERLLLKELNWDIFYKLFTEHDDDYIKYYMGITSDNDLEIERNKFEGGLTTYNSSFKSFLLVHKKTNRVIGRSGFHNWYIHHYRAEIGYKMLDDNYLRQGYMTEANEAIISYGFEQMGLNRIEAYIGTDNIASYKLLMRFGFMQEGILREHYFINNRIEDSICFSLLKSEYMEMRG